MPLSGCGDFPSPCAVAGHAPGRAPGLAASCTLLGLASLFCKLGLAALVPEGSQPELERAATNSGKPAYRIRHSSQPGPGDHPRAAGQAEGEACNRVAKGSFQVTWSSSCLQVGPGG